MLRSEAVTLLFLQEICAGVPSPRIYDWACPSDPGNEVGMGYILMQKMEGKVLNWDAATKDQRERVLRQLVDIYLELGRHPFTSMGSLVMTPSPGAQKIHSGALATPALFGSRAGKSAGPFQSAQQGAYEINTLIRSMIATGKIGAIDPVDSYLMHRFWAELNDRYWDEPRDSATTPDADDGDNQIFYLKHPDDKGDHILVNEDYDIVGMIDWEGARTVSKEEAFASPCMTWPVGAFCDGAGDLAADEVQLARLFDARDRPDLARCVLHGRRVQRLAFAVDHLNGGARYAQVLFRGLRLAFDSGDDLGWDDWRDRALARYKEDRVLQTLLRK